jgi:hypothetical protein
MKQTCPIASSVSLIHFSVIYTLRAGFLAHHSTPVAGHTVNKIEFYKRNYNSLNNPHNLKI